MHTMTIPPQENAPTYATPGGRAHRLVVVAHPLPQKSEPKEPS